MSARRISVLTHAHVLTLDEQRRILSDGAVAFSDDGTIVAVGPTSDVLATLDARRGAGDIDDVVVENYANHVVAPGFIDAHVHLGEHVMRGLVPDDADPDKYLPGWLVPGYGALSPEDEAVAAELAFAELLLSGTTTVAEAGTLVQWDTVLATADQLGIRYQASCWTWDLPEAEKALTFSTDQALQRTETLLDDVKRHGSPLLSGAVVVLGLGTATEGLMRSAAELAQAAGVPLGTLHASSAPEHGGKPIAAAELEELGWLGPSTKLVHAVYVDDADLEAFASHDVSVVHCPTAALRHAKGIGRYARFTKMLELGIPVALGGDSANGSNHVRMNELMWLASALPKDAAMSTHCGPPEVALEMATRHGARALGLAESVGSIEVGKQADLVAFSADRPEWRPMLHPVQNLVLSANSSSITDVWVRGQRRVDGGELVGVDLPRLCARAEEAARSLLERTELSVPWAWPRW